MKWDDSAYRPITEKIIGSFYRVHDELGPGLREEAYHNALCIELKKMLSDVSSEKAYPVMYDGTKVSTYIPDIVVDDKVVVEVKAVQTLNENHKALLISQLRVSKLLIGLLVNFGNKDIEFKRYDNFYEIERLGLRED